MHLIASTFNRPSAVSYSLACSFRGSEERFLAVLRTDRLLIYVLKPHGTELVCEREIWGQTRGLLQLETSKHLVVSLDIPRAKIIVIDFNPRTFELTTHHTSTISPLSHRPSVGFSGTIGRDQTVCASFYNGHVKVLQVGSQAPYEVKESDLRVHELTIQSMCFTLPASDSVLAIVYTEQNGNACIIGRNIDTMDPSPHIPEKVLKTVPDLVIPVRIESATDETVFGILLFARKLVTFLKPGGNVDHGEDRDSKKGKSKPRSSRSKSEVKAAIQAGMVTTEVPFNDVSAWTQVDGTHLVIGDSFGRLFLLSMSIEPEFKASTVLLGQVSVPSTLSYLSNNVLYVGSESGPSQLVRIATDLTSQDDVVSFGKKKQPDEDTSKIEILVTHNENIAPIMDAALVDPDGSGQSRIATISGDDSGGRLNVIHKGASFRELAIMEGSANLDNVFPLKKYFDAPNHVYLVATTNTSTFLLTLSESSLTLMSPDDLPGISRTGQTVLVANVNIPGFDAVIHITPNSAALVDLNTGRGFGSWNPPRGDITAASVDTGSSVVCIATSEGYLYCLSMQLEGLVKTSEYSFRSRAHFQVSALTISGHMVAAAFWGSNDVQMLKLPGLQKLPQAIPAEPFAASNVLLTNFGEDQMYLIAARLDGALVVQAISPDGTSLSGSKRVVPLGGGPIQLASAPIPDSSLIRVVAAGKRGVALSIINKRLSVSALPILDICALASANPPGIGPSIVYASSSGLVFGQIEQLDKLNISSFHLGSDSPLRLAHHSGLSTYIIGCVRTGIDTIEERHIVRFLDDATFKDLGQVKLKYSEIVTSITTYSHEGSLCVFVGTGILSTGENEPQSGRIIMFKAEAESGMFRLETSKDVDGAVSSIKQLGARIVAAINHGVYAYDIGSDEPNIGEYIAKWERGYILDDLVIREDTIVVSDKLRSVSVLRLVPPITEADDEDDEDDEDDFIDRGRGLNQRWQFETIAMDMHAVWPTSVEVLEGGTIIAAQLDGNILTWELDDGHLEPRAAYHIGEIVNRFIALPPKSGSGPKPLAMFVTNTGRVVTLSIVHDNDAVQLTRLEMKMGNAIKGLGDVSHADWRAPKLLHSGTKPPPRRGVTDGDFIKTFLELDPQLASKILSEGSAAERIGPAEEEQIRSCLDALSTVQ